MKMFNNTIRRGSGANLNLFRYAAMLLCVLLLGVSESAWAGSNKTYYSKVSVSGTPSGYGTVYVKAGSSFSGTKTEDTQNSSASSAPTHTYSIKATPSAGYAFKSWSGSSVTVSSTSTASTTCTIKANSTTSGSPTSGSATATFEVIKATAAPADVTINATDPSATYPDAAGVVVGFTTSSSNANSDFTTGGSGDSRWTISSWPTHASATSTTFNYKFVGNGSYGTNNRTFTKTVTLKGLNDATVKTCTLTAKYPNPRVVDCNEGSTDLTIYPTFKSTDETQEAVEKTAVFDVVYADNANNFTAAFSGATGSGIWTVTGISVDQANQKATVTYTFNGNKSVGTHTAILTLTANDCSGWDDTSADGGASATVTLTAENTQEATNDASVTTTANVTTEYATFAEALAAANATSGATLTLLRNVDLGTITATNNINKAMTIDLNGKELRAAVNATSVGILNLNANVAVTIKDSKTGGKIINEIARNAEIRTITVTKGTLTLESGTITVHNTGQYASAANADLGVSKYASCQCRTIHQAAGTTVNVTGGRVEAYGTRSVYGILQASSAATNNAGTTILNVSGGEIYAEGPYSIMGIYAYGKVNFSGGTINVHVNTNMIDARYAADNANNFYNGYGYGIYANVSSSATASSCYYATVEMTGGTINVTNDRSYNVDRRNYGILFNAASTVVASGKTGADGTLTQKASATGSIDGGEINVTSGTQYSFGVYVLGDYNSYDNTHHTVQIKNCKITSKAYVCAYGVAAWSGFNGTNNGCYAGDVELTNCDVYAESLNTSTAAAVWVTATGGTLFKDDSDATKSRCYGEYAVAGKAVINSGKYEAKTKTTTAMAVGTSSRYKTVYDSETTVATNRKPGGNAEAYPTLIIHGGTFKATSTTTTARGVSNGGYCTIDGGTFEAFATTTTAQGLYCLTGKITASGVTISASATQYAYGALADVGIPTGNTAQTGFAYAGEIELNNCDITATTRTSTEARGVYVNATNKLHNWTTFHSDSASGKWAAATTAEYYRQVFPCKIAGHDSVGIAIAAKATINGCDIKATAATTTAYGVYSTATSVPATADSAASPVVNIKNSKFTVKTDGTTTAYGVYAGGPTMIDGCDFTVQPKTTTAYGVYAYDKKTTITNTKFDVKGTTTAYGLYANAAIGSTTGWDYHGEFELGEGNDMTVVATAGNTSHVLTLIAAKRNVASGRFMGDYANAASALITGGKYKATATGTTSYVLNLSAQQVQGSAVSQPSCTIEGGKFWALASGGTTGICTTNGVIGNILFKGGVYNVNTTLSKHIPEGYEEVPLASDRSEYTEGYRYEVDEAGMHGIDVCQIGSTKYKTLEEALQVVTSGQVIYMIANYIMNTPGDYVLPANTTLLIPYKTGSGKGATTAIGNSAVTTTSATTPSLFRKLTFGEGVNLTCFGTIETSAEQKANGQYGANVGMPSGAYGQIHLEEGSHISLEANSRLNCWGYITGKGTINVKKDAKILEGFQMGDWCGGSNYSTLNNNSQKVFPVTHYFYQSIECPITYRPGSRAYGSTHINVSIVGVVGQDDVPLVGTSGSMFIMDDNDVSADTWVMKDYDEETDQCIWTVNSGASIGNLTISISSYNMKSANYDLPITTNMSIVLNYGEMAVGQNTVLLPGSQLIVNKQGTAAFNGVKVTAYDAADWTGTTRYFATYSPTWGTTNPRKNIAVKSAEVFLHGKLDIRGNGGLYTTPGGANVHSTNADAGEVIYTTAAPGSTTNYYLQQGGTTRTAVTVSPAKLKNGDGSYAESAGTASGKTWTYKNDVWDAWSKDGCFFMNAQDKPHAKPAALVELTSKTPDANHLHHDAETGLRNFVWDADCYWWEVVTEPTQEGYYRSINADNNGDYNYYYYDSVAACWKIKKITVTWNINGSNTNYSVGYGTKPEWLGATPTKTSTSSNYVWRWDGWTQGSSTEVLANNDLPYVTENTTFTAHFYEKYYEYNVTFKNSDGTILESKNWIAGTTPYYDGTPTKNPTAAETYEFNGTWSPAITAVTGSATYTAQYTATPRAYTITFLNYDMSKLGTAEVAYNGTPTNDTYLAAVAPVTEDPYKPDNSAFSFEFAGWKLQGASSNGFAQVKGDQTYIAQFNQTTKKYKVSFVDDDETLLHWTQLEYGQTPSYTWDNPANKQDVEWTYSFAGWDPSEFATVEGPQTYTAVYNKTKREYDITWVDGNGETLKTDQVAYGETPEYSGATPTKESTNTHNYTFNNTWSPAIVPVEGEATYTAQFNETERKYRVTWDANGGSCGMAYNDFSYNAAIGTLPTATKAGHTFNGWFTSATGGTQITTATKVTADVTYHAHFTINTHSLTWDANGGELSGTYTSGTAIAYGTAIDVPTVSRANYIFNGWHNGTSIVTPASTMPDNALTYTAQWTPAVASVTAGGTTYYSTFGDAIDAANGMNNAIVTMLQGVTVTSQIELTAAMTIDLNGKTITSTIADATTGTFYINASGKTITIRDSGTDGKIYQEVKCSGGYLYGIHVHAGTLTIESGTIYTKNTANKRTNGIYTSDNATAINILTGGKVETVSAGQAFGIYIYNSCALTINGGTVTANGSANVRGIYIKGTTTLTNATIESTASGSDSRAIFTNSGVNLTINSGTYTATGTDGCYAIYERSGTTLTINGGRFSGREKEILKDGGSLTITGGVYKHDTDIQGYCATNYHVFDLTSGADYDAGYRYEVAEAYKVTWNATENGGSCETAYTLVKKGTAIGAVPEASKTGHDFLGWFTTISGGGNQVTAATIINFATTAYARFAPSTYDITYKDQGDSDFSGVHGDDYPTTHTYGTVTALVSPTKYGYTFEGWYDNAACTGSALTEIGATAYTADLTLYAKWAIKTNCTITWLNYNDTPLHQSTTSWGGTPYYPAHLGTPTREGDEHRTYTFKGWSPEIHPADGDETYIAQYNMSITTGENGSYTVSGAEDAVATTVQVSGSLHVPEYNSLTTTDLILEASDNCSGMIEGLERLQVNGNAYFDYDFNTDPWHWSAFGVPFEIDIDAAPLLKEKITPLVLGSDYDIVYYDSEERALHGPSTNCWKYVEYNSHTLVPGRLYMIAFNRPLGHVNVIRFTKASGAAVDFTSNVPLYNAGSGINDNWNGIANPKLFHALLNAGVTECQVHDGGEIKKDGYDMYDMNNKKFFVGKAVFVQVPYNQSPMYADPATTQGPIVVKAPRRTRAEESAERYDVKIAPMAEEMEDHIYLLTSEDKADEYVIVADLVKAGVSPVRAQMWVERYGVQLCKNTTEWINNVADYPLGISVPADGDYDIWLEDRPDNDDLMYLTLDGERIWNLSYGACTIELKKGTTQRYGIRVISNAPSVTTGMDAAGVLNEESIRKVLIDEKVYIIRNGELYSITGQKAK